MTNFKVFIDDHAHYMDESERADHGAFASADDAVAECKRIVDDDLVAMWRPGTTAAALYRLYMSFGPDPFVVPLDPTEPQVAFSAADYAKQRCRDLVSSLN